MRLSCSLPDEAEELTLDMEQRLDAMGGTGLESWGPQWLPDGMVDFRIWAPDAPSMKVVTGFADLPMTRQEDGWHHVAISGLKPGDSYSFRLPDGRTVPDPASRAQAGDVHGPSLLIDHDSYEWKNNDFRGLPWEETVILEMHVGTFTPEGTFRAAIEKLPQLRDVGITAIEIMPVAQFRGERGWGYDGVLHYAPHSAYGTPDDFKALVDAAHGLGLMVFLDVVYNHFGPEGNYLGAYASPFFRQDDPTPWGASIDFSNPAVRKYFADNAMMWIGDYRIDGIRFDATEQIRDEESEEHFLEELTRGLRTRFADRHLHLIAEDQRGRRSLLRRDEHNQPVVFTGTWSDSLHHCLHVLVTGESKGHYKRFEDGLWDNLRTSVAEGFLFPDDPAHADWPVPPNVYVNYIQNHDQIGNRAFGNRLNTLISADMMEVLTAMMMLIPHTPMLFQGEDFNDDSPFCFFADFEGELGQAMRDGRLGEAENFGGMPEGKTLADLPDPMDPVTFHASKIEWSKADSEEGHKARLRLKALTDIRREHIAPLMRRGPTVPGTILPAPDGLLAIDWAFPDGTLSLRVNLTDQPARLPGILGTVLYAQTVAGAEHGARLDDLPGPGIVVGLNRLDGAP